MRPIKKPGGESRMLNSFQELISLTPKTVDSKLTQEKKKRIKRIEKILKTQKPPFKADLKKIIEALKVSKGLEDDKKSLQFYLATSILENLEIFEITQALPSKSGDIYTEEEEEIFSFWSESELTEEFLEMKKKFNLKKQSLKCIKIKLAHLIEFYQVHFKNKKIKSPKNYPYMDEIGEKISLNPKNVHTILLEEKAIKLICAKDPHTQAQRILIALETLKHMHPVGYQLFLSLTHTIVYTDDAGIVSHSSQDLPGFSVINLKHRDDIDLLDDLLHENGHHHLNFYLNQKDLIFEEEDLIYYSPWRKSVRPLRGIYHGYLTFFWAYYLFKNLSESKNFKKIFDLGEQKKIKRRALEERNMLVECHPALKDATERGVIYPAGAKIVDVVKVKLLN